MCAVYRRDFSIDVCLLEKIFNGEIYASPPPAAMINGVVDTVNNTRSK